MNAREYEHMVGAEKAQKVAEMAGTKWRYWRHFVNGYKRPGYDLARRLVKASEYVTPDTPLSVEGLMVPADQLRGRKAA